MERRDQERFLVDSENITGTLIIHNRVKIHDISMNGACLIGDKRFEIGREYRLSFECDEGKIPLRGTVNWAVLSQSNKTTEGDCIPIYKVGMQFTMLPDEAQNKLKKFITQYRKLRAIKKPGESLVLPFDDEQESDDANDIFMDLPERFTVKKLDAKGMVVESRYEMAIDQTIPLEMHISKYKPLEVTGKIAYCLSKTKEGSKRFDIGIEFVKLSERDRNKIDKFVQSQKDLKRSSFTVRISSRT